jgi:hypothetical protein
VHRPLRWEPTRIGQLAQVYDFTDLDTLGY